MAGKATKVWECVICSYQYDEAKEGVPFSELPDDWECPDCGAPKSEFEVVGGEDAGAEESDEEDPAGDYLARWARTGDQLETVMADIHKMAGTGKSITEAMRTQAGTIQWDDILFKGAQLARIPLNHEEPVATRTVIGPRATHPLVIETPVYITHMSFGALSKEVKLALARGSAAVETAMCSGEGGILPESMASAHKYIFEYIPNRYSVTDDNLQAVDAIEIKIGQSAKPGMGGHLPADKVTDEIAKIRGFPPGRDIISPASYEDIRNREDLKSKVAWLREKSGGKPIGIKFAAGDVEADLQVALYAEPDFITIDGRPGATAAAPKHLKAATSVPTIFALRRARRYMEKMGVKDVTLVITGGLRISSDFAKALALGADAIAIGSAALMACGCQQYRICHTGRCPVGITTQDEKLRARLNIDESARRLSNYLRVCTEELQDFARITGKNDVHQLGVEDLCTVNHEIARYTDIEHV